MTREIAIVLPPPGKDMKAPDLTAALAAMEKAGITVRIVEHDAPEVIDAIAAEHADPEAFRRRVDMDRLMSQMGKVYFDPCDAPAFDVPERKMNRAQRRKLWARRGGGR